MQETWHPLAAAIGQGPKDRGVKPQSVTDFASVTGGGVVGKLDSREILVGKLKFLEKRGDEFQFGIGHR